MPFTPSQIAFGAYTFPAATRLLTRDQPSTIDEEKIPYLDGTNAPAGTRGSKIITIEGTIGGSGAVDSAGTLMASSNDAENELNLMTSYLGSGYQALQLLDITPARTIQAQKRKSTFTPVPGSNRTAYDFVIEFIAPDPRWLAAAATTVSAVGLLDTTRTIAGSTVTYPVATLTGAGYNTPIVGSYPGNIGTLISLRLSYTTIGGDVLVVDCDPRNRKNAVVLNGVARLDLIDFVNSTNTIPDAAFFPYLIPGANRVVVGGFVAQGTSASVTWREAYAF